MTQTPLWYQNAVFYQLHVRCFYDDNNDGIGDFSGLTKKLEHIHKLGCNVIWLQPFYPSPLLDDGYDIANYYDIHPNYGTLKDFRHFLNEAHKRNIKIVTELVINHTSDQHPWFQKARHAKSNSKWRNFYMWSDDPEKYRDARIIFKDFELSNWSWDPVAKAYYWHRFFSHQPDLNYDNPEVHKEIFKIVDFWMNMGVDGMRLDAIPYLYSREGTDCENLPETHQFLKKLRHHVDKNFPNRILIAEANQWPDQAIDYFGKGDECHMAFHFPVMPRLFMAIRMEDRFPIIDIMDQTPPLPEGGQWATFLRNHDELTLEMVTDEERDYMYRAYAKDLKARINLGIRRRLAPLLDNDRKKIELMNMLLFSLPGSPIVYYGDELGMGDNYYLGDRNGVRTPMQWNNDRNAGFSKANPQQLYLPLIIDPEYHHAWLNAENQERSTSSLLCWMRTVISLRRRYPAFGTGEIHFLQSNNLKVLAFIRETDEQSILVIVNLSRHPQHVDIDLTKYSGSALKDLFSQNNFGPIHQPSNNFSLGKYEYFWLLIEKEQANTRLEEHHVPELHISGSWESLLIGKEKESFLNHVLPTYLKSCRWFRSKAEEIKQIEVRDLTSISHSYLLLLEVTFSNKTSECYLLPLSFLEAKEAAEICNSYPQAMIAKVTVDDVKGVLIDATYDSSFQLSLLDFMSKQRKKKMSMGLLAANSTAKFRQEIQERGPITSKILSAEQTNSSVIYGDLTFLKLYRKIEDGINPDIELVLHLSRKGKFPHIPAYAGALYWNINGKDKATIALAQEYVPNEGDLWSYTLDALQRYYEEVLSRKISVEENTEPLQDWIGWTVLEKISLLGKRTAEMHIALAHDQTHKDMKPENFTFFYQRSLYQSFRSQVKRIFISLRKNLLDMPQETQKLTLEVVKQEEKLLQKLALLLVKKISSLKIRIHGDFHLGQIMTSGNDITIIDFEGEPAIPLTERKLKRSPIQDVAGMVRSFHYASVVALNRWKQSHANQDSEMDCFANFWFDHVSQTYLSSYLETMHAQSLPLIPNNKDSLNLLLYAHLINKAVYEVGYEMQNRPEWLKIPLLGLLNLMENPRWKMEQLQPPPC